MAHGAHDLDDLVRLSTDEGVLIATLHVSAVEDPSIVTPDTLRAVCVGAGVREQFIDAGALETLARRGCEDPLRDHAAEVARGVAPRHGTDASYTLRDELAQIAHRAETLGDPDADTPGADGGEVEVDHYERTAFIVVHRGDEIGTLHIGADHEDGTDLYGQSIPSRPGTPPETLLDTGTIEIREDNTLAALVPGRLRVDTPELRVDETLEVLGDVDFTTGRIDFPGPVRIRGAVRDHFHVHAEGDIEIGELVEEARVSTPGSLTLRAGMAGKDSGRLTIGADLDAGYLERARGEVRGDARIERELTGCEITIRGELHAERAAIRGGSVNLSRGGVVGTLGSIRGVETTIVLGSVPRIERLIECVTGYEDQLGRLIQKETERLETLERTISKPNPQQIEEQMSIRFTIDEMREREQRLGNAEGSLKTLMHEITGTCLTVRKAIHAKVTLVFPRHEVVFTNDLEGECVLDTDASGAPRLTHRGSVRPLTELARVLSRDASTDPVDAERSAA